MTGWRTTLIMTALTMGISARASAATVGFVEDFEDATHIFNVSGSLLTHETSGGVGGADDGWLRVEMPFEFHLGVASDDPLVTGNLLADGVTGFSFWLRNLGGVPLEIHIGFGQAHASFWQHTIGWDPPSDGWQQYAVDLNEANWTRIRGTGTFLDALQGSERLLFRHDRAPYGPNPDPIIGAFGLDRVEVLPEPATGLLALLACAALRRRPPRVG
jgi:hypothetical protein